MGQKFYFLLTGGFCLLMSFLLWRSEYGTNELRVGVPLETVLQHVFEAADPSNLEIRRRGEKIGYCRWSPTILSAASSTEGRPDVPEGMITSRTGYDLDFDGSLTLEEIGRLRFNFSLTIGTNQTWQELQIRFHMRPWKWELFALAATETIEVSTGEDDRLRQYKFQFHDLRNPSRLMRTFGQSALADTLDLMGFTFYGQAAHAESPIHTTWESSTDRLQIGHTLLDGYLLRLRVFEGFDISISVLESGEILKVELPNNILLLNDDLLSM